MMQIYLRERSFNSLENIKVEDIRTLMSSKLPVKLSRILQILIVTCSEFNRNKNFTASLRHAKPIRNRLCIYSELNEVKSEMT